MAERLNASVLKTEGAEKHPHVQIVLPSPDAWPRQDDVSVAVYLTENDNAGYIPEPHISWFSSVGRAADL